MAEANMETVLKECELKDYPRQFCQVLLTASCLACPYDPIQFLKDTLIAFQGHCILKDVDWHKFVAYTEELVAKSCLRRRIFYTDLEDDMVCISLTEKALDFYIKKLTSTCFSFLLFLPQWNETELKLGFVIKKTSQPKGDDIVRSSRDNEDK